MNTVHRDELVRLARKVSIVGGAAIVTGTILRFVWSTAQTEINAPAIAHADQITAGVRVHADSLFTESMKRMDMGFQRIGDILDADPGSLARHRMVERLKANH